LEAGRIAIERLAEAQAILGMEFPLGAAHLGDSTASGNVKNLNLFDAALTSPPYAMALPYIDTQRLSLVWLGLVDAKEILALEAKLVGSREMRGAARRELHQKLADNGSALPEAEYRFCRTLQSALSSEDGFRRQAVPPLLYRYFEGMRDSFRHMRKELKPGAPYALIVGHNHTILAGVRFNIDTPRHLASLATSEGWELEEIIELQTYQRYGYHMDNAVSSESLILLRNR
jgi:site-specific DNA-methyltransferase (cytosine-N4-specific)